MSHLTRLRKSDLPRDISFAEGGGTFLMELNPSCTSANMQENKAAFEAWALFAKSVGYERVVLTETESPSNLNVTGQQHYNRFLFRLHHFLNGFDWFDAAPALKDKSEWFADTALSRDDLFVNAPLGDAVPNSERHEAMMERLLILDENREMLNGALGLNLAKYYNQLPVGLFDGRVIAKAAIFPRSGAAIDIWGIEGSRFHLIELKVGNNQSLGVLSEVFFYACFMYEMYCKRHLERKDPADLRKYGEKKRGYIKLVQAHIDSVAVHILTERKHPRLDAAFAELARCNLEGIQFCNAVCYPLSEKAVSP